MLNSSSVKVSDELASAGIRSATRMVVGKHRKRPLRVKDGMMSYSLENKGSMAIWLALAECLKEPAVNVYLVSSVKEPRRSQLCILRSASRWMC
ncbi:hypothetical protein [Microcoleus vaginatus]|uniref:hypothetical protein n=1 Tax=Microcoleus vaginatus TaxID=119532 RepID=UPI001F616D62